MSGKVSIKNKKGVEDMTIEEIENYPEDILIPKHIASILKCDPYCINLQADKCPEKLGFPVSVIGSRVKIPRIPFLNFIRGKKLEEKTTV